MFVVFVCTAALAIMDRLDVIDHETMAWWLAERQVPNGGLNGRPEKLPDVRLFHLHFPSSASNLDSSLIDLLQLLGPLLTVHPQEGLLDRLRKADTVHPVRPGHGKWRYRRQSWGYG